MSKQELVKLLEPYGQQHIVHFWDDLNDSERTHLQSEIQQTDFAELNTYFERVQRDMDHTVKEIDSMMNPVPDELKGSFLRSTREELNQYELTGLKAIANGEVAVLLLAGGQGTRLGVNYPKGMYSVDLKSKKTLYQLQAERLVKLKQIALKNFPLSHENKSSSSSTSIPWYIMTSEHTQESTQEFFKKNGHFGLDNENIVFFEQFMLPCLSNDGKVLLDEKHKMSRAPDGNGGLYRALFKRKIIDDMVRRGVKYVHVYCVDNILVKMADPTFVGFCLKKNANCAAKVVRKIEPDEKVGVICKVGDRFQVVEYSEISEKTRNLRDKNGDLVYNAGNICNHFLSTDFLQELCTKHESELKHHVAHKKIPFVDIEKGEKVLPKNNNGIKLEKFVFDVFPFSTNFAIWEVPREEEFSPLKNSNDAKNETPVTCRKDLYAQHVRWLKAAGATFKSNKPEEQIECEISPLVSYNGEGLSEIVGGRVLDEPLNIEFDKLDGKVKFNGLELGEYEKQLN